MATSIEICSNALNLIGHGSIASFTEGGAGANIAAALYETTYKDLLSQHRWRFASAKATLSRLVATPANKWSYAFQLPADYIVAIYVYPNTDYEIYEDKLYSNMDALDLDYIFKPDESKMPAYFQRVLEFNLAAVFAVAITDNPSKSEEYRRMYDTQLRRARFTDAQARPPRAIVDSPFIDVRK